ncbi:ADP/ATP translocase 4-like isoform X2 [Sipha flava]|uniref:ADP/ATP translocase n=2 Tax=Sipha flava TaxID=143950 RepID=A0A8B8GKX8_9HEMI|nr:ADP/ATP translocase 4-like isoform X2 [Sipha flava]
MIMKKDKERSNLHEFGLDAVSSAVATAIARSVVAPFDRVKIISQVHYTSTVNGNNNLHYHPGILTTLNQIYREQGLRALWFGNFTNILRFVPSQAVMFGLNTFYLKFLLGNIKHKDDGLSHTALSLISGGLSGATTLCMFYPLLFCQTHLAAHVGPLVDREYTGLLDCIQKTVHTNGVRALYTGFAIAANGMVINKAIYFGAYYSFNKTILDHTNSLVSNDQKDVKLPFWIRFATAQVATYLSQLFSYPLDTIGRVLIVQTSQEEKLYLNARDCFTKLWNSQGLSGLYRGMLPNMIRSSGSALILVLHDEFKWTLSKMGLFGGDKQDD